MAARLILNADDFGLTAGVNRAVSELYAAGALASATLMANGAAFDDAIGVVAAHPSLDVGCHVVLVDGSPVAPAGEVASLLRPDGQLQGSLLRFAYRLQRGRLSPEAIRREATAQIRKLQQAGICVTHVDTHKHTHMFPKVARAVMQAASDCGVSAIRNPFEPVWSAKLTRGAALRKLEVLLLRGLRGHFANLLQEFGMRTTAGCLGVSATGKLNAATLQALLESATEETFELVCHPGFHDAALDAVHTRLKGTREVERAALLAQVPAAVQAGRLKLTTFAAL